MPILVVVVSMWLLNSDFLHYVRVFDGLRLNRRESCSCLNGHLSFYPDLKVYLVLLPMLLMEVSSVLLDLFCSDTLVCYQDRICCLASRISGQGYARLRAAINWISSEASHNVGIGPWLLWLLCSVLHVSMAFSQTSSDWKFLPGLAL